MLASWHLLQEVGAADEAFHAEVARLGQEHDVTVTVAR
jgi:hypothetical protein